ncbi:MAG: hypothetical protein PHI37_02365 [Candidatus Gracilibacteria bacterium]|nr:hypothetical protein [Candidatus Gracilibacteria bacterium]
MNKKILNLIKILFIFLFLNLNQTFAATNTWEFDNSGDYTLSDNTSFNFNSSVLELNQNTLSHQGRITNRTTYNGAYDVVVDGNYAYMTSYLGDRVTILDISNPTSPTLVSQILNNNGTIRLDGAAGIVKDGNYLYVASQVSDALQIINVANPASPTAAGQIVNGTTLNGARGITKSGNYVYVVCDTYDALQVINVTNPASPSITGTYRVNNGNLNGARDVKVVGNYAYVAAYDRDSLAVMDISNPASPTFVTELRQTTRLNGAHHVEISGNYAYVSAYLNASVMVIDISNPLSPTEVTNISGGNYSLTNPRDLLVDGNKLFITSYGNDAVNVVDITNPATPVYITKILHNAASQLLDGADGIFKVGNYLYISSYISDALEILRVDYDSTSPFVQPISSFNYGVGNLISSVSNILGGGNQGSITYQISKNNGTTWYYFNGTSWVTTTGGVAQSNTISQINTNIALFNALSGGTGLFTFKAFFTSNGVQKVELDSFTINTQSPPGPGGITGNLSVWYKTNFGLNSYTDNANITNWQDSSPNGKTLTTGIAAPNLVNNTTNNLNFYPLVNFNGNQSLENLANGGYSNTYFAVIVPNQDIDGTLIGQVPFSLDCNSGILSSGTCGLPFSGITLGAFTVAINDEVLTHAIGSSTNWRSSQIGAASYTANKPMLLSINENSTSNGTDMFEKGLQVNNYSVNTYQTLSSANISLGRSLDPANIFPYNGKIAEIINFSSRLSDTDRQKIESYLATKYGITLNDGNQNYLNSLGNVVWNYNTAGIYKNNIFGLGRDDNGTLSNVVSRSSNNNGLLTIGAIGEGTNISPNFVDISDLEFLYLADNNLSNTWIQSDTPVGYDILNRKWKVTEIGDLGTLSITFDVNDTSFDIPNLNSGSNYYFIYDSNNNGNFNDETPISMNNTSGSLWNISGVNLQNNNIFTIATQSSSNNIPSDIILSNNNILENISAGSNVGILSTIDLDTLDTHTYTFASGLGDTDNAFFTIVGDNLNIIYSPDYEIKNSYNVRIQTDDGNGGQYQKAFIVNISDSGEAVNSIIDFEINDPSKYGVTSGNWFRGTSSVFEGTYSFESNNGGVANTQSCFEINNTFYNGVGTIDFKYSISSQANADYLRFYIDNIEQQFWSGNIGWSTYNKNDVSIGTHNYKWCYIKDGATNTGSDKAWIDYITFSYTSQDIIDPTIDSTNFSDNVLLPGGNHNILITYSDIGSGIDSSSANMELYKWDGSSWGANIYSTSMVSGLINTSQANYSTNNLAYGKYKYIFRIHDNYGNFSIVERIFYIDQPNMNLNTSNYISSIGTNYGSGELILTVNTVGAGYSIELIKNTDLIDDRGNIIINWDGNTGVGYDNEPYLGPKKDIPNNPIIGNGVMNINNNGNLNTYIHKIKIKSIVGEEQFAGDYNMDISFRVIFNY